MHQKGLIGGRHFRRIGRFERRGLRSTAAITCHTVWPYERAGMYLDTEVFILFFLNSTNVLVTYGFLLIFEL